MRDDEAVCREYECRVEGTNFVIGELQRLESLAHDSLAPLNAILLRKAGEVTRARKMGEKACRKRAGAGTVNFKVAKNGAAACLGRTWNTQVKADAAAGLEREVRRESG